MYLAAALIMRHILYIINPIAGAGKIKNLEKIIREKTKAAGIPFQIYPSVASGDYSFLIPVIRENKITDIVIAGGDGTISQAVGSLMNEGVNFGILPIGSGNGLAFTARIPKQIPKALDLIFKGKASAVDGFLINNQFACMLCGLGLDAKVAHDFANSPGRGLSNYVKQVIRNFFSAKTYSFGIESAGKSISIDAFFLCVANSNQFGNNFKIAPNASLSDGLLDIVAVTTRSKLGLLLKTIRHIRSKNKPLTGMRNNQKTGVIYFQTEKVRIINHNQAPLHIDGDPAETPEELMIIVRKKCFRLIQPAD